MASKTKKTINLSSKKKAVPSSDTTSIMVKRKTHGSLSWLKKREKFGSFDDMLIELMKTYRKVKKTK